MIASRSSEIG